MSYDQTNVQLANVVQRPLASNLISRVGYLINDRYDQFGRHLGLDVYDLRNINQNHATAQAKAVAVIEMWIESRGRQSWVELKEKLITFQCQGIVQIIEEEFPSETSSSPKILCRFSANEVFLQEKEKNK
nr:uncharacterized protein LOC124810470 [Hydra vulgaris]